MNSVLPPSWRHVSTIFVGGITEVGFTTDEQYLLLLSNSGRGLIETHTGTRVARDRSIPSSASSWIDESAHIVGGIGPASGIGIACVGLWGGRLPDRAGEWRLRVNAGKKNEFAFFDESTGQSWYLTYSITETRAYGFSKSGKIAIIATSSEVVLYHRTA
jgi:hypothetical protein